LLSLLCLGLLSATAFTTSAALRRRMGFDPGQTVAPRAAYELVAARPYSLEQSYISYDRKEQPTVNSGWALVLRVPGELAKFRNSLMPVLCVGPTTAERWNSGEGSGHIIVTVPSPLAEDGRPQLDLHNAPVWFAQADLPERVDAQWIAQARAIADQSQLAPFDAKQIERALALGGAPIQVSDHSQLGQALGDWVAHYAPDEAQYAGDLRNAPR
jgi:hypothetical protein